MLNDLLGFYFIFSSNSCSWLVVYRIGRLEERFARGLVEVWLRCWYETFFVQTDGCTRTTNGLGLVILLVGGALHGGGDGPEESGYDPEKEKRITLNLCI